MNIPYRKCFLATVIIIIATVAIALGSQASPFGQLNQNTPSEMPKQETLSLGYCPTLKNLALEIQSKNGFLKLEEFGDAARALSSLKAGKIDFALVGRPAKENEIENGKKLILGNGFTLIAKEKKFISPEELESFPIHTALTKEKAGEFAPEAKNITFHKSLEEAISNGMQTAVLIDWKDYQDTFGLAIPVNENGKIEKFRLPVVYSVKHELQVIQA